MDSRSEKSFIVEKIGFSFLLAVLILLLVLAGEYFLPGPFSAHPIIISFFIAGIAWFLILTAAELLLFPILSSGSRWGTFFFKSLRPVAIAFNRTFEKLAELTLRLLRLKAPERQISPEDVIRYISGQGEESDLKGSLEVAEGILQKAVEFSSVRVRDCMTPRTEIVAIEENESVEVARRLFIKSGHSKLPVYRESIDEVIGYIHLVDLFHQPETVARMVMPMVVATESMPASDLLKQLIDKHRSLAVVVDEFGGTAGLITIEDIMEEIVGEIQDEHDVAQLLERKEKEGEYYFSGRLEIDYLNENYHLMLPENAEYETLAGLILYYFQNIPKPGDLLRLPPYELKIISMQGNRINEVRMVDKRMSNY